MNSIHLSHVRILLVEDDEDEMLIIKKLFAGIDGETYSLDWIQTFEEAILAINKKEHDLYLVDYRLGHMSGLDLLRNFNLTERPEPFIILTGTNSKSIENRAMEMGVADFLIKGKFDGILLSRVIRYSMQRKSLEAIRIKALVDMNKSKDEFISLASHQLRTPATAVKQYIGMIIQGFAGDITDQQRTYLDSAYNSNERQLKIVNAILGIARLDLNKVRLSIQKTDVNSMIKDVIDDVMPEATARSQKLIYTESTTNHEIYIDRTYLGMAINNIVDNAIKYSPEKTNITVKLAIAKDECVITVEDQGVGISMQDRDKLFKKFSRIDNPLSISANGTGVGLYWSSEVIRMHKGKIDVSSELNIGTTFRVVIPNSNSKSVKT